MMIAFALDIKDVHGTNPEVRIVIVYMTRDRWMGSRTQPPLLVISGRL